MTRFSLSFFRAGAVRLLAVAVALVLAGSAVAQDKQYNDTQLDAFAEAAIKVAQIRREWMPKIKSAESKEDAKQLSQQAVSAMRDAVDGTDNITVEQYDAIAAAVQKDEALRKRLDEKIKAKAGGQ